MDHFIPTDEEMDAVENRKKELEKFAREQKNKVEMNVFNIEGKEINIYFEGKILYYSDKEKGDYCSVRSMYELLDILEQVYHYDLYGTYGNFAEKHFYPTNYDMRSINHNLKHWQINEAITVLYLVDEENYECTNIELSIHSYPTNIEELLKTLDKWTSNKKSKKYEKDDEFICPFDEPEFY